MNLLLLHPEDQIDHGKFLVHGRRFEHIRDILGLEVGAKLRAGLLNGALGEAHLLSLASDHSILAFTPSRPAPLPSPITLILALPRPKMLKRILIDATSLGVKRIVLLNSYKVEKSYWATPELHAGLLHEKLLLGLEQAGDTLLPVLQQERLFKPFMEDRLPALAMGHHKLLAHPGAHPLAPAPATHPTLLAIGPEGGWTDYEVGAFLDNGFQPVSLGARILRVETAVPALLGRLLTESAGN